MKKIFVTVLFFGSLSLLGFGVFYATKAAKATEASNKTGGLGSIGSLGGLSIETPQEIIAAEESKDVKSEAIVLTPDDGDSDDDGLSDDKEKLYYTDPANPDTDNDGFTDGEEIESGYSPHKGNGTWMHENDYDGDQLNDWLEIWFASDVGWYDTDRDGYDDWSEVMSGYDPREKGGESKFKREIIVDRTAQRLYFYVDGVKVKNYPVSTGNPITPTPAGTFAVRRKLERADYRGRDYFLPSVKWNMEFLPSYFIHAATWHNDFGLRTRSHGCVNMSVPDSEELYKFVPVGMSVTIIGETPKKLFVGR